MIMMMVRMVAAQYRLTNGLCAELYHIEYNRGVRDFVAAQRPIYPRHLCLQELCEGLFVAPARAIAVWTVLCESETKRPVSNSHVN